jgi:phage major head subunit gpT-like protein
MPVINRAFLDAEAINYQAMFKDDLAKFETYWQNVATKISTGMVESVVHNFMQNLGGPRLWVGPRVVNNLRAEGIRIVNQSWEDTFGVWRTEYERDSLGLIPPRVLGLARGFARLADAAIGGLINTATAGLCYDGVPFASAIHPDPGGGAVMPNTSALALATAGFFTAKAAMMAVRLPNGAPCGFTPDTCMVGPDQELNARTTFEAATAAAGASNPSFGACKVIVNPYMTVAGQWLIYDSKAGFAPFIFQEEVAPVLESLTNADASDTVFSLDQFQFGARSRCGFGYGVWQACYLGT